MPGKKKIKKDQKITLYEEDFREEEELEEETVQLVVFRMAKEWYGVDIANVKEVTRVGHITYLPSSPEYITGIVNLRGEVISVTDLKKIFGLPPEELTGKSRLVVIESADLETGLLVDEITKTLETPINKIDSTLSTISPEKAKYIEGAFKVDDKLIGILKVDSLLKDASKTEDKNVFDGSQS